MSNNNGISKVVNSIIADTCKDCKEKCGLCEISVCEEVVKEIGCYFLFCAEQEDTEQEDE